jgi:hypothetical protein
MIPTQIMSAMADAAAQRYGMLLDGFKTIYTRALDAPDFGTPKQISDAAYQAVSMSSFYLIKEEADIEDNLDVIAETALTATRDELSVAHQDALPDDVSEHLNAFSVYMLDELRLQIERDIAFLNKTLRATHLTVHLAARAQRVPLRAALITHRVGSSSPLQFAFHDRRSAKWPSKRHVRTFWRHNLLAFYNDSVLMTLADHGIDNAQIKHNDPASEFHGMIVTMSPSTDGPTYADVKDAAFHPNAEAVLVRSV